MEAGAQTLSWDLSLPESGRLKSVLMFVGWPQRWPQRPGKILEDPSRGGAEWRRLLQMISPFNIIKGELGRNFRSPNYTKAYTPNTVCGLAWSEMRGAWSLLGQRLASAWSEMRWGSVTVWTTVGQRLDKMGRD